MGSKLFENPLLGHKRMRAIFRALVETRLISDRDKHGLPRGLEACWVGTAIDLRESDVASDREGSGLVEHIRLAGMREGSGAARSADLRRTFKNPGVAFAGDGVERLFCAVGAAMALKAAKQGNAVIVYVSKAELKKKDWRRVLTLAANGDLPLVIVAVPEGRERKQTLDLHRLVQGLALPYAIPVIATDASDAVALYRVAQESFVRARAEGGTAIIDCLWSVVDPIEFMATQLVMKQISNQRWIDAVEPKVKGLLAKAGNKPRGGRTQAAVSG